MVTINSYDICNFQEDNRLNILSPQDQELVWFPKVAFDNMPSEGDSSEMLLSLRYQIIRNTENTFQPSDKTDMENSFLYSGAENKHHLKKEFTVLWICNYQLTWYPFDSQTCSMNMRSQYPDLVDVNPGEILYAGPKALSQYVVKSTRICRAVIGSVEGVVVDITLGRPLISNILTVFIPTVILLVINHMTKVYDKLYLDMVIQVSLTVLLVLATL